MLQIRNFRVILQVLLHIVGQSSLVSADSDGDLDGVAGGGSDLANYYEKYGGAVLSTAINKYSYLCMHPYFFKDGYFLKYSQTELVDDVNDIKHNIIREVFKLYNIRGVDLNSSADIPSGTGLSSSSAFTAGLIHLCNAYNETYMTKEEIAEQACQIITQLCNFFDTGLYFPPKSIKDLADKLDDLFYRVEITFQDSADKSCYVFNHRSQGRKLFTEIIKPIFDRADDAPNDAVLAFQEPKKIFDNRARQCEARSN